MRLADSKDKPPQSEPGPGPESYLVWGIAH